MDSVPKDGQSYNANPQYGLGNKFEDKGYCVYGGSGSSVKVTGLKKGTLYYFAVFEYNNNGGFYEYNTSSGFASTSKVTETITANFTIDKGYQCLSGNVFTFTNKSSNTVGGGMSYKWDYGDGATIETTTNGSHTYSKGGYFKVKLTATTTGCVTDTSIQDTVVVPYIVDFGLDKTVSDNDSIQCFGLNTFNIKNLSVVPNPPIYGGWDRTRSTWSTSQGHSGTAFNFDFQTSTSGQIKVKLIMARQVAKGAEYCLDSIEKIYEVLPPPLSSANVSFSDTLLCLNDNEFRFFHNAPNIVSTKWDFGDNLSSNNNPAIHSYSYADTFYVKCTVVDNQGCEGEYTDSVIVVPPPNNYFTGLSSQYCIGDPVAVLKPNLSGGMFEGGTVNAIDSTFTPNTLGDFTIRYIFTLGNCKDTFSASTKVLSRPEFDIGADTVICANSTITLKVDSPNLNYQWDDFSTAQTRTVDQAGTYWVKADNGNCSYADTIEIVQVVLPTLELGNDTSICGGEAIGVSISADAGSILWNDGNTEFNRKIEVSGFYKATITHPCGTVSDSVYVDILPTACDIFIPNAISPNGDFLNEIFYPLGLFKFTSLMIFDEYGMNLFESYEDGKGWDGKVKGEVCPPGTYYYLIRYQILENGIYTKKIASGPLYLIW